MKSHKMKITQTPHYLMASNSSQIISQNSWSFYLHLYSTLVEPVFFNHLLMNIDGTNLFKTLYKTLTRTLTGVAIGSIVRIHNQNVSISLSPYIHPLIYQGGETANYIMPPVRWECIISLTCCYYYIFTTSRFLEKC